MEDKLDKFFDAISTKITSLDENQKRMEAQFDQIAKNHSSSIHNIEVQLGQLANAITTRGPGHLPSNTETNPRDVKAITLRSGKELNAKDKNATTTTRNATDVVPEEALDKTKDNTPSKGVELKEDKVPKSSPPLAPEIPFSSQVEEEKRWRAIFQIFGNF